MANKLTNAELADAIDAKIDEKDNAYAAGDTATAVKGTDEIKKLTAKLRKLPDALDIEISHPPDPSQETETPSEESK